MDPDCPRVANLTDPTLPCYNGGSCWNGTCCCPPNFTGSRCEMTLNQCLSTPCKNGGLCKSGSTGFTCYCLPGIY
jgi:hypothetical protein